MSVQRAFYEALADVSFPERGKVKKETMWQRIAYIVNAVRGNGRSVTQVKKRWKDIKSAVTDRQRICSSTGGGGLLPRFFTKNL